MKLANNLQHLTLAFIGLFSMALVITSPAHALDNYKEFRRDHWDFDLGAQYFYSEANYSSGGDSQNLPSGNHYQLLDTYLSTRYVPKKNWSLFAAGNVGSAESKSSAATRTNSTINEVLAGLDFLMYSDAFQIVPEVSVLMPFEKISATSDTVANSEGVLEVRSRLTAQKDFGTLRAYGWLGFTYRGEGRSFLMPWGVAAQLKMNRLRLGAELFGFQSVTDDTNSEDTVLRTAYVNGVNAGSLKFYGKNPSLLDTNIYATWLISKKWSLQANGGMTVMGAETASGFHVGGFIRYTFDLTEGYAEEPAFVPLDSVVPNGRSNMYNNGDTDLSSEKKVKKFREETDDGIDQDIFKPRPTKKPINKRQLKKQLDEAEFQIELKAKKKRKRSQQ